MAINLSNKVAQKFIKNEKKTQPTNEELREKKAYTTNASRVWKRNWKCVFLRAKFCGSVEYFDVCGMCVREANTRARLNCLQFPLWFVQMAVNHKENGAKQNN